MTIGSTRWLAISPLLDDLLEMGVAEREARLEQLRQTDPALAADVQLLLAGEEVVKRDAFLDGAALPLEPALAGHPIGDYTLDRPLARGGMGSVWLAHRSDGRYEGQVAVKFLNLALVGRGGAERFEREGRVLARLAHPNIARLLDAGVAAGGQQPYLVLEYVDGAPIDRWCDAHGSSVEVRIRLFLDVLASVEFAHRNLILHRDLKPGNILVTSDGQVKLLDFGIAKLLDDGTQAASATELTQLAGAVFTPEYAAPEQIQRESVTTATDVYSLGVLLYRLLSGEHPTSPPEATPVQQLRAVLETEPARVSLAASRSTRRNTRIGERATAATPYALSGDLDTICAKALKKQPGERYPTAAAFADDLQRYLDNRPVSARPDSSGYRLRKFVHRHRLGVGAAAATLFALIAGIIGTTWQAIEARRERDVAVFEAERASASRNLVGLMLGAIGDADQPLTPREILDRSVALVEKQFMNDPRIAVDMLLHIAGQYLSLGDTSREYDVMQRAGVIAQASGDPGLITDVACNTVETEILRNRIDLARSQLDRGLAALARIDRPESGTLISCTLAEANFARQLGSLDTAIARSSDAIALLEREGKTRGSGYAKLLSFLGDVQRQRGDLAASYGTTKKLQRLDEQLGRSDTVDYLVERHNEAVALSAFGEFVEARKVLDKVVARWSSVAGGEAMPAYVLHSRGVLALRFGALQDAERDLAVAAAQSRARGAIDRALRFELSLARARIELGQFDEADRLLQEIERAISTSAARSAVRPAVTRAELLLARGMLPQAVQAIEAELDATRMPVAKDSLGLAAALLVAARIELAMARADSARSYASLALAMSERLARDPSKSAYVGEALLVLARAQGLLGDGSASIQAAKRAALSLENGLGTEHRMTREALSLAGAS